jgi:LysR family transcriptional regulator, transcriptional activator of nhaA
MIPFNYHHLYYFYVIAREGSISKASSILGLAQPTVSAQLKQFENFLNVELFRREKRRIILTEEGHKVLSYARLIFDIGQELKDRMVDLSRGDRPRISIGITHYVPKTIVDLLMNYILQHHNDAAITLETDSMENLIQNLQDHILDIIMTDTPFETNFRSDISNKFIGKIPIVFCAHVDVAHKIRSFPKDLENIPVILPTVPKHIAYSIREFFYDHHVQPRVIGEIGDIEIVRRLALRGYGIAALNLLTIQEAPAKENLIVINPSSQLKIDEKIYIISKKRKQPHDMTNDIIQHFDLGGII